MSKRSNLYTGRAGHLAVMAELLLRGWNTAIPEVDVGDDIFVVHDSRGDLRRVQVKTARASKLPAGRGHRAQFNLSLSQLQTSMTPEVTYIFAVRLLDHWDSFVVIDRDILDEEHSSYRLGSGSTDRLVLQLRFEGTSVTCKRRDLSQYRNNWTAFPVIEH